jgi:hypothetical protein
MFDLLRLVHDRLHKAAFPHALIGAGAMSVVGYVRATQDLDFLVISDRVLNASFWIGMGDSVEVEINDGRMDWSDPLAGVVRIEDAVTLEQVDIVVGKHPRWQEPILDRANDTDLSNGLVVPVAQAADLVLLKLFAGSPHDDNDIRMLLHAVEGIEGVVDDRIESMAMREQQRWITLRIPPERE